MHCFKIWFSTMITAATFKNFNVDHTITTIVAASINCNLLQYQNSQSQIHNVFVNTIERLLENKVLECLLLSNYKICMSDQD